MVHALDWLTMGIGDVPVWTALVWAFVLWASKQSWA
jgi:hypothetical protein